MPKTYIVKIDYNYPFNLRTSNPSPNPTDPSSTPTIKILRSIPLPEINNENRLSHKILFAYTLRNRHLIKIQSVEQTPNNTVQIAYEHVRTVRMTARDPGFWECALGQLENLGQYLGNIGVRIGFNTERMCITGDGVLKYYLGLEFGLNQGRSQEEMQEHYQREMEILMRNYKPQENRIVQYKNNNGSPNKNSSRKQSSVMEKYRKASFVTLPSKIPYLASLNTELTRMKTAVQEINQFHYYGGGNQNERKAISPTVGSREKRQLRKYSGDTKMLVNSNRKLSAKFSDFKSDRYSKNNHIKEISHLSTVKYDGQHKKSKIEQMKYQQYIQITKSNKNYLNDFLSVLEDDHNFKMDADKRNSYANQSTLESRIHAKEIEAGLGGDGQGSAELLKQKAQESIKNSLRLIRKVKAMC